MYGGSGPFGDTSSGADNLSVSTRTPDKGWQTRAVLPAGQGIDANNVIAEKAVGTLPSADFSKFAFYAAGSFTAENPVTGQGTESQALNIVQSTLPPSEWFVSWLTKPAPGVNPIPEPGHISPTLIFTLAGASPALDTVYFSYFGTLVPEDDSRRPGVHANDIFGPWGFYEWHEGKLVSAAGLPNGEFDPYGAMAAGAYGKNSGGGAAVVSDAFHNQVSRDGSRAFFVSPDPETEHPEEDPIELYMHKRGQARGVLISRDDLHGGGPAPGYPGLSGSTGVTTTLTPTSSRPARINSYMHASPDGSRVFFESMDKLAEDADGLEPAGSGPWMYEFKTETEQLTYLPGVEGAILSSSSDGSTFIFERMGSPGALELWANGVVKPIATFSNVSDPTVAPVRVSDDASVFVWETDAQLDPESFNNGDGFDEVYRYDAKSNELSCLSCPPTGIAATGEARLSNDDKQFVRPEVAYTEAEVAGSRGMSSDGGRVFFDTPDPLVAQDVNGKRDVYQWEDGEISLISSGQAGTASVFMDNSESGDDVFFATTDGLVEGDYDGVYDVYDARSEGGIAPPVPPPAPCRSDCQGGVSAPPEFELPLSNRFVGVGNPALPGTAAAAHKKKPVKATKKKHAKAKKHRAKKKATGHKAKVRHARRASTIGGRS